MDSSKRKNENFNLRYDRRMELMIEFRKLEGNEIHLALQLALEVFMEFEAPDYTQEGIKEFGDFLNNQEEIEKLEFYGALDQGFILGVLAMRQKHISLLFVKKECHRKGIAKRLFSYMLEQLKSDTITVNSSPYAQQIYEKLGFVKTDMEQITNGIRYIPMIYVKK